jgi:hypothetical protein
LPILISANAECKSARSRKNFRAHVVWPNGKGTVGDWLMPQIDKAYEAGKTPPLFPGW